MRPSICTSLLHAGQPRWRAERRVACTYGETIARLPQVSGLSCSFRVLVVIRSICRIRARPSEEIDSMKLLLAVVRPTSLAALVATFAV
jgi:hypothetical protein